MTVQVSLGGGWLGLGSTVLGTTVAGKDGQWTFNYTNTLLSDGSYTFQAAQPGLLGGVLGLLLSVPFTVTVDTKAPAAPAISGFTPDTGAAGYTNCKSPTLNGTAAANSTVTVYLNGAYYDTVAATASGAWSYTVRDALADGSYSFSATATDLAGNVSCLSNTLKVTVDTKAPTAPTVALASYSSLGSNGSGGYLAGSATPTFTGTGQAGTTITILDGNIVLGTAVVSSSGTWTFTSPTLARGTHDIRVFDTDLAGNQSPLSNDLFVTIWNGGVPEP
jgi:hypothetical protein